MIKDKDRQHKVRERTILLTSSGRRRFKEDFKTSLFVDSLQKEKIFRMDRKIRAVLFPWSIDKIKFALNLNFVENLEEGTKKLLGAEISIEKFNKLYQMSSIYRRISSMEYEKSDPEIIKKRQAELDLLIKNKEKKRKKNKLRRSRNPNLF